MRGVMLYRESEGLKLQKLSIVFFCFFVLLVFCAEKIYPVASELYWLDHFFFGIGFPWFLAYLPVLFSQNWANFSFKQGVYLTATFSLLNEYVADVIDNKIWVFSEQIVHTAADFSGILCAMLLFLVLTKYLGVKA